MTSAGRLLLSRAGLVVWGLALSGCGALQWRSAPEEPAPRADVLVLRKLAEYAEQSSASMRRLAQIESDARTPGPAAATRIPLGLDKRMSLTWNGPLEGLVGKVGRLAGYTVLPPVGRRPAVPILVSIAVTDATAADILQDAGAQAGQDADIVITPASRKIEINYPPVPPPGGWGDLDQLRRR